VLLVWEAGATVFADVCDYNEQRMKDELESIGPDESPTAGCPIRRQVVLHSFSSKHRK